MIALATDELWAQKRMILDGYGIPFDPIKYLNYLLVGMKTQELTTFIDPCGTGIIPPYVPLKELPAGHYEKGSGV